ncbi:AbrB/MazE/SpoVT family DNA-binding domain-containing protein [Candidatus Woesearchaeota archaeon]|nr:AbrB/MazE/SpoVT family DNA-binding domain-containing protein [Candidatus Woesearchaeota archaeon]
MDILNVSSKGQIVIPEHLRKKLNIRKGTRLVLLTKKDTMVLTKETDAERALQRMDKEDLGWLFLNEQALAKDWDTKEEDEAWKDL